jgi:hypothetical protein
VACGVLLPQYTAVCHELIKAGEGEKAVGVPDGRASPRPGHCMASPLTGTSCCCCAQDEVLEWRDFLAD